jgi:hypothetical protein
MYTCGIDSWNNYVVYHTQVKNNVLHEMQQLCIMRVTYEINL